MYNPKTETAERLVKLFLDSGISEGDLARATGIPQPTIHRILTGESREPRRSNINKILKYFDKTESYLYNNYLQESSHYYGKSNVAPGPEIKGMIPVVSWVNAGNWIETEEGLKIEGIEEWLPCPKPHSDRTFGLRVQGDSMVSPVPGQHTYPPGIVIYVDPEVCPEPGKRVVARINGSMETTFKMLVEDSGKRYLKPLNPQYPMVEIDRNIEFVGVVIGSYWPE